MAESTKDSLLCSVCLETFKEPKVLPCCHTFCKECLTKLPVIKTELESAAQEDMYVPQQSVPKDTEPVLSTHSSADLIVVTVKSAEMMEPTPSDERCCDMQHCMDESDKVSDSTQEACSVAQFDDLETMCTDTPAHNSMDMETSTIMCNQGVSEQCSETSEAFVGYIACPQCRSKHKLIGRNGVDRFLTDYVIEAQIREQNISSNKTTCDECESTEKAVSFCSDCTEYLCDFCTKAHERQKRFAGHNVTSIVLNVGVKRGSGTPIRKRTVLVCPQHHGEIIQLFCQQCETVVCNKCIVSVHSAHKLSEIDSKTRKRVDKQLASLSTRMERELTLQAENLKYVNKVEKMTNDMVTDLQQKINKRYDAYSAALERRRKELLSDCESKSTSKMKTLWSQRDSLETVIADMTATQNFTKRVRKCEDNGEFLLLTSQVLPRLKKLESWKWNGEMVENLELYSVDFQESSVDVSRISRAGTIKEEQLPCYTIDFHEFSENVALGKRHSFTIHLSRGKGCRSLSGIETPSVSLRHIRSQTCDVATVRITRAERKFSKLASESQSLNTYGWTVTYTPYCGGQHILAIRFENITTEREITVLGKPEIGSRVMRGPDHDGHGAIYGTVIDGTVIRQRSSTSYTNKVMVQMQRQVEEWARGNRHHYGNRVQGFHVVNEYFSWGADGRYEVQLFH